MFLPHLSKWAYYNYLLPSMTVLHSQVYCLISKDHPHILTRLSAWYAAQYAQIAGLVFPGCLGGSTASAKCQSSQFNPITSRLKHNEHLYYHLHIQLSLNTEVNRKLVWKWWLLCFLSNQSNANQNPPRRRKVILFLKVALPYPIVIPSLSLKAEEL